MGLRGALPQPQGQKAIIRLPIAGTPHLCYHGVPTVGGSGARAEYEKEAAMAMPKTALEGIRVLDLGRYQAGPHMGSSWRVWGPR